jgi:hypothetical protein
MASPLWRSPSLAVAGTATAGPMPCPRGRGGEMATMPYAFGVTLNQADVLDRLVQTIAAHGDVIAASHAVALHPATLPALGAAVHDAAVSLRALLDQVATQRL